MNCYYFCAAFEGLRIEPTGVLYQFTATSEVNLTSVTLDTKATKPKVNGDVQLWIKRGTASQLIAVVSKGIPHVTLNINISVGEEVVFYTVGNGIVYVNGSVYEYVASVDVNTHNQNDKMEVTSKDPEELKKDVIIEELSIGNGPDAKLGDTIAVFYEGRVESCETPFCSQTSGDPFKFQLGSANAIIPGWNEGIMGMKVGSKRRLFCTSKVGYGELGIPLLVPPNANLIFHIEHIDIVEAGCRQRT